MIRGLDPVATPSTASGRRRNKFGDGVGGQLPCLVRRRADDHFHRLVLPLPYRAPVDPDAPHLPVLSNSTASATYPGSRRPNRSSTPRIWAGMAVAASTAARGGKAHVLYSAGDRDVQREG